MSKTVGNYVIETKIGAGNYATVYKAVHKINHDIFAIKMIAKEKLGNDERLYANLESEIMIMRDYIHPNVVRLYENLTSGRNIYLILEYCPGGDLYRFIRKHKHLSDTIAKHFFVQLVDGLTFLHSKNVIHRDIKPQNLLLNEFSENAIIKIADFGFAKSLTEVAMAHTQCGTPLYMVRVGYLYVDVYSYSFYYTSDYIQLYPPPTHIYIPYISICRLPRSSK